MLPNRAGVPLAALALTRKPEPGVLNTAPRGDVVLKKSAGNAFGDAKELGTPSQLIVLQPEVEEPPAPLSVPPRSRRNWFTKGEISAVEPPVPNRITGLA